MSDLLRFLELEAQPPEDFSTWYCDRAGCDGEPHGVHWHWCDHPEGDHPSHTPDCRHARAKQVPPEGNWFVWLLLAGRGLGKSRAAAEWIVHSATHQEAAEWAVVARNAADVRKNCRDMKAGITAVAERQGVLKQYNRHEEDIYLKNGAIIHAISADKPDRLRGFNLAGAWADETCLPGGALIRTETGEQPINRIRPGSRVYTRSGLRRVLWAGPTRRDAELWELSTADGSVLHCTPDHRVWASGRWCSAASVVSGEAMEAPGGEAAVVVTSRLLPWREAVTYDLTVEGEPEFFANGLLVHNCAWRFASDTWDYGLIPALRAGEHPRVVVTTTPKPIPLIKRLVEEARAEEKKPLRKRSKIITTGSTFENTKNLAANFIEEIKSSYAGTRIGRQEIEGELLFDTSGALVTAEMIENARLHPDADGFEYPDFQRIVVAVDPAGSYGEQSDETGIIVCAKGRDGHGYVLADRSCKKSPHEWAGVAAAAYEQFQADAIAAEKNMGHGLVEDVIRSVAPHVKYIPIQATAGKRLRAEPITALYEISRIHHLGTFPKLEDQLCIARGTAIATRRGDANVETVAVGDEVWTREGWRPVVFAGLSGYRRCVEVATDDGHVLRCTPDHPIWVVGRGFVAAGQVEATSVLLCRSAPTAVTSVSTMPASAWVYDITVADTPEFFAGGLLVHNCSWTVDDKYSPDRMDALVHGFTELGLAKWGVGHAWLDYYKKAVEDDEMNPRPLRRAGFLLGQEPPKIPEPKHCQHRWFPNADGSVNCGKCGWCNGCGHCHRCTAEVRD